MQITRSSIDTVKGPADWFTGDVYLDAVAAEIEVIAADQVNEAYERVLASDVRYRFVIDAATLA